jgi:hypothetical protein
MSDLMGWVAFIIWMGVLLVVMHRLLRKHPRRRPHP